MYRLIYSIDANDIVADEDDHKRHMNKIHRFLALLPDDALIEQSGIGRIPPYEEHELNSKIKVRLVFQKSEMLFAAFELLRAFCVLNYYIGDEDPFILSSIREDAV